MMQRLAQVFADERSKLEQQWSRGDDVSTEDLRVALAALPFLLRSAAVSLNRDHGDTHRDDTGGPPGVVEVKHGRP